MIIEFDYFDTFMIVDESYRKLCRKYPALVLKICEVIKTGGIFNN